MRVLLTGATGFLGQALCDRLIGQGAVVRALVRSAGGAERIEELGAQPFVGDLRDTWSLHGVARGVDTVLHAAAVHRGGSLQREDFWQTNSEGTRRLLQEAVSSSARRFVYVSTAGVHGDVGSGSARENSRLAPADLYQITKLRGEQAVRRISHAEGIEFVILRPSTIYGPGDTRFLKLFQPIARRRFVLIGSGRTQTHFVSRDDAVDAILAASTSSAAVGETFLVAGPRPAPMRELVAEVAYAVGVAPPTFKIPYAPVLMLAHLTSGTCRLLRREPPLYPRRLAFFGTNRAYHTDKIESVVGVRARIELSEGIRHTAAWYQGEGLL